jgi:leader peptidase (prepilin peptidase)/N-methyltransferase
MHHLIILIFLFALGACVGSFLNVVVWRLPRDESLLSPPSRCPFCEHRLAWFDNVPVFGWLALRGRCRYCFNPVSAQYPAIEFLTGALFVLYYVLYFVTQLGPCWTEMRLSPESGWISAQSRLRTITLDWPPYLLAAFTISALLAASLIDLRHFVIPISIPLLMAAVGVVYHTIYDRPRVPGSLNLTSGVAGAMALGAGIGLLISNLLLWRKIIPQSFAEGWPALEIDKDPQLQDNPGWLARLVGQWVDQFRRPLTAQQEAHRKQVHDDAVDREARIDAERAERAKAEQPPIREFTRAEFHREMAREMIFLLPAMILALVASMAVLLFGPLGEWWQQFILTNHFLSGFLGSLLGALVGGLVVWITRILGTLAFGREAMGMGDVHLMFGVGAIIGAGAATVAFLVAPFFGILVAAYMLLTGKRRELPYGPYLSLATAFVMIWYCDIANYLRPGMQGLSSMVQGALRSIIG